MKWPTKLHARKHSVFTINRNYRMAAITKNSAIVNADLSEQRNTDWIDLHDNVNLLIRLHTSSKRLFNLTVIGE